MVTIPRQGMGQSTRGGRLSIELCGRRPRLQTCPSTSLGADVASECRSWGLSVARVSLIRKHQNRGRYESRDVGCFSFYKSFQIKRIFGIMPSVALQRRVEDFPFRAIVPTQQCAPHRTAKGKSKRRAVRCSCGGAKGISAT
jgi:hypothetical protein